MHPTSEMMSKCRKWHLREPKFAKFHGGACPQTPLEARASGAKKYLPKHKRTPLNRIHPTGLKPHRAFFLNARPHLGAFTAFSVENDKCPGGGQARQELDDYVNQKLYFLIYLSFLSITKTSYQHRTEHFLKGLSML